MKNCCHKRLVEAELVHVVLVDLLQLFTSRAATPGHLADDDVDRVARDEARQEEVQQQGHEEDHEGPGQLSDRCISLAP